MRGGETCYQIQSIWQARKSDKIRESRKVGKKVGKVEKYPKRE